MRSRFPQSSRLLSVLKDSLDQEPQAEATLPVAHGASIRSQINLVLRTNENPARHADSLRRIVGDLRQDAAVDAVEPLASRVADSVAQPRFAAAVLLSFAGVALSGRGFSTKVLGNGSPKVRSDGSCRTIANPVSNLR